MTMITDEYVALAKRAVAVVPITEWPEGTATISLDIYDPDNPVWIPHLRIGDHSTDVWYRRAEEVLPDFRDALTRQAVLLLVRRRHDDPGAFVRTHPHFYDNGELLWYGVIRDGALNIPSEGPQTEIHALVQALEADPC